MMDMPLGALEEKEAVVVNELAATVEVQERSHVSAFWVMDELNTCKRRTQVLK